MDLREFSELIELRYKRVSGLTESEEYRYRELDAKASIIGESKLNELYEKFKSKESEPTNPVSESAGLESEPSNLVSESAGLESGPPDLRSKSIELGVRSPDLNMGSQSQIALLGEIHEFISKLNHLPKIEFTSKLDSSNWREFKIQLIDGLEFYDLNYFIDGSFSEEIKENAVFKRYDKLVKTIIKAGLSPTYRDLVLDEHTAFETYMRLSERNEGPGVMKMVSAVGNWYNNVSQFENIEKLIQTLRELITVFNKIKSEANSDTLWCAFFLGRVAKPLFPLKNYFVQ